MAYFSALLDRKVYPITSKNTTGYEIGVIGRMGCSMRLFVFVVGVNSYERIGSQPSYKKGTVSRRKTPAAKIIHKRIVRADEP